MRGAKEVIVSDDVAEYLSELSYRLFVSGYFGFPEDALDYVDEIYDRIFENVHIAKHHEVPGRLRLFGDYYFIIRSG